MALNTNQRVKALTLLNNLIIEAADDGNVAVTLANCSVSNISLCQEFAKARRAKPRERAPHPTLKNTWQSVPDELDKDPRYLNRNQACKVEAGDFSAAVRKLYDLTTEINHVVLRGEEQDAGWGNSPVRGYTAFEFNGKDWSGLSKERVNKIMALNV